MALDIEWFIKKYTYHKESGLITNNRNKKILGSLAKNGYVRTYLQGKEYKIHRLAWLLATGGFPKHQIDHINHNISDNRWENIRDVSVSTNQRNKSKYKNNNSGTMGVYWRKDKEKWHAQINVDRKSINLGLFLEYSCAVNARKNAEVLYGFHKNHNKG